MVAAIRADGLTKSFGATVALRPLDLEVAEGEVLGYLGPNGAGKTTTIRCLLGLVRASAGRAEIFGVDAQARPAEAHRRVAYVPGEANLWPGLTGQRDAAPARPGAGQVDTAYRDELIERFQLDPSKRVRAYSKGNRQKVLLIAAPQLPGRPADPRRADERARPADGAGLPRVRRRGTPSAGRRCSCPRTSSARSRRSATGSAILRAGELVEVGTLAEMRHLSALSIDATFDTAPPDLSADPGCHRGRGGGQPGPLPGGRLRRAAARRARRRRRAPAAQPRTVARGAVPRALRPRAGHGSGRAACD